MDRTLKIIFTMFVFLLTMFTVVACEVGVRAKIDSRPSDQKQLVADPREFDRSGDSILHPTTATVITHGTDGCDYAVAKDGQITKVQGSCPTR